MINELSNLPPGVMDGSIKVDDLDRQYLLYIPKSYSKDKKMPLLIALHGRFETGETMMKGSGFNGIADKEGFIVAYPYGYRRSWADGRDAVPADKDNIDDVKFITTLMDYLIKQFSIAKEKVFISGYSNGAVMANTLAVKITDRLAGVASVEGDMTYFDISSFPLSKHIPIMFVNGTADKIIKIDGGSGGILKNYSFPSIERVLNVWKNFNGCHQTASLKRYAEKDDGTVSLVILYDCVNAPVELILDINAGHIWPEYKIKYPQWLLGKATTEINASDEIWKFFKEST